KSVPTIFGSNIPSQTALFSSTTQPSTKDLTNISGTQSSTPTAFIFNTSSSTSSSAAPKVENSIVPTADNKDNVAKPLFSSIPSTNQPSSSNLIAENKAQLSLNMPFG